MDPEGVSGSRLLDISVYIKVKVTYFVNGKTQLGVKGSEYSLRNLNVDLSDRPPLWDWVTKH